MTTSLHFGPEWMRDKRNPKTRNSRDSSPPPTQTPSNGTSYSSILTPASMHSHQLDARDSTHPFRYSKDEILQVWRDGGGRVGLGLEVERWEGIINESAIEPIALKDMTDVEKKLFGSVNSDLRRRTTHDSGFGQQPSSVNRPKLGHASSSQDAYGRERNTLLNSRRKKDNGDYSGTLARKLSLNISQTETPLSPRELTFASPKSRQPSNLLTPISATGVDSGLWSSKRNHLDPLPHKHGNLLSDDETTFSPPQKEVGDQVRSSSQVNVREVQVNIEGSPRGASAAAEVDVHSLAESGSPLAPPGLSAFDPKLVHWTYIDPTGKVQGPFDAETMQKWNDQGYFHAELLMRREVIDGDYLPLGRLLELSESSTFFLGSHPPVPSPAQLLQPAPLPPGSQWHGHTFQTVVNGFESIQSHDTATSDQLVHYNHGFTGPRDNLVSQDVNFQHSIQQYTDDRWGRLVHHDDLLRNGSPGSIGGLTQSMSTSSSQFASPQVGIIGRGHSYQHPQGSAGLGHDGQYMNAWFPARTADDIRNFPDQSLPANPAHTMPLIGAAYDGNQALMQGNFGNSMLPISGPEYADSVPPQFDSIVGRGPVSPMSVNPEESLSMLTAYMGQVRENLSGSNDAQFTHEPVVNSPVNVAGSIVTDYQQHQFEEVKAHCMGNGNLADVEQKAETVLVQETIVEEQKIATVKKPTGEAPSDQPIETGERGKRKKGKVSKAASGASVRRDEKTKVEVIAESLHDLVVNDENREKHKHSGQSADVLPTPSEPPADESFAATFRGKAPWAPTDSTLITTKSSGPGLRQIQQSELKKEEERKAAERKQRTVMIRDDSQSQITDGVIVGTWGLLTSQTGTKTIKEKEPATPSSNSNTGPVWTNVVRPQNDKKSMKEILEDEKKYQALQRDKEINTTMAKRAYAESATKASINADATSGGWTTVGSTGKTAQTANSRAATTVLSVPSGSQSNTGSQRSTINSPPVNRVASSGPKVLTQPVRVDDVRHDPSLEFLRWLRDSLKGLNSGVNVDEFMQMLLSFPVEVSQDTIDLIQEQAYANSTTIDGRRFAAEFIARRKADAQPQASGDGVIRVTSLADVVKAPQKVPQSDWGYKVVKKKGKGAKGR